MKNGLLGFISLVSMLPLLVFAQPQFDNASFEQWNSLGPYKWNSVKFSYGAMEVGPFCSIERSNSATDGNYSIELQPTTLGQSVGNVVLNILGMGQYADMMPPAFITNGTLNVSLETVYTLMSIFGSGDINLENIMQNDTLLSTLVSMLQNGKALGEYGDSISSISGYYNFEPESESEVGLLIAILTSQIDTSRIISGGGVAYSTEATDGFEPFNILINKAYPADEVYFIAMHINLDSLNTNVGTLKLDDINIHYDASSSGLAVESLAYSPVFAYPNPATNNSFKVNIPEVAPLDIFNVMGQKVKHIENYVPNSIINLNVKGMYFVNSKGKIIKLLML